MSLLKETKRLYEKLSHVGFNEGYCKIIAPLILQINKLKEEKDAVILAHSYQTPDIIYGVADYVGDSYQLGKIAQEVYARRIIFCGVRFMAETAKILNPLKEVIIPAPKAGCSLADSATGADVRNMRKKYPGRPVVAYINTSAEVKAEVDVCVTSSNAEQIINALEADEIVFFPDALMGRNLADMTGRKLIIWNGKCIVHEDFRAEKISRFRKIHKGLQVMVHSECTPEVVAEADFVGGTQGMVKYMHETDAPAYMMVTECGLSDRMRVELPEKEIVGMCSLCPYMKMNTLPLILNALRSPAADQIVEIPEDVRVRAEKSLKKMYKYAESL
jgi:quinolinate synthase